MLVPLQWGGEGIIVLDEEDIFSVTLTEEVLLKLEIQARYALYSGIFEKAESLAEVVNYLKEHMNIDITCEYKGGIKYA